VGGATEKSHSPAPTTEATVPEAAQQAAIANELRASTEERRSEPSSTGSVEPEVAHVEEEAPAEVELLMLPAYLALRP
jgi:hypothetical protein